MRNIINILLVLLVIFSSSHATAETENFQLYLQGKVVASIQMMNQELWKKQFTARQLNRMISRLNSAYETNLGVDTELYVKALDKIRKQKAAVAMEMDVDLLYSEFRNMTKTPVSTAQVQNLIGMTDRRFTGVTRSLRFLAIKMIAHRIYLKSKNLKALYLAGLAGHHRFNTGTGHLGQFVELCQLNTTNKACVDHLADALQKLTLSEQLKLGK